VKGAHSSDAGWCMRRRAIATSAETPRICAIVVPLAVDGFVGRFEGLKNFGNGIEINVLCGAKIGWLGSERRPILVVLE
jgi:hypothetical protein